MKQNNNIEKSDLEKYRAEIDKVDTEIIQRLAKRFEIVKKIGEYKKKHNLPALDKKRWQEVLSSRIAFAKSLGLPEELIKKNL